jgi:hypothetical protein
MADYGATERVRQSAVERYVRPARAQKRKTFQIHSGSFEKELVQRGLLQRNRFPIVCNALRSTRFLEENHLALVDVKAPPSGQSSTVIFTYRLQDEEPASLDTYEEGNDPLLNLRGILANTYKKLGGAERFHKAEREAWGR